MCSSSLSTTARGVVSPGADVARTRIQRVRAATEAAVIVVATAAEEVEAVPAAEDILPTAMSAAPTAVAGVAVEQVTRD